MKVKQCEKECWTEMVQNGQDKLANTLLKPAWFGARFSIRETNLDRFGQLWSIWFRQLYGLASQNDDQKHLSSEPHKRFVSGMNPPVPEQCQFVSGTGRSSLVFFRTLSQPRCWCLSLFFLPDCGHSWIWSLVATIDFSLFTGEWFTDLFSSFTVFSAARMLVLSIHTITWQSQTNASCTRMLSSNHANSSH